MAVRAMLSLGCLLLSAHASGAAVSVHKKPHLLMLVVDDFGWADAGWHRAEPTPEVVTPNMDALVKSGIEFNRHYVHMMCTPSRAALYSGRLPVHVLTKLADPCDKNGAIPRNMTGIAAKLKEGGYATHHVGKWDAGMSTPSHTPQGRGFDTSLNYFGHGNWGWTEVEWGGSQNHRADVPVGGIVDFWDTDKPASSLNGTGYEEDIFLARALSIIRNHDPKTAPLFLTYASKIVHYPLQIPESYQKKFAFITDSGNRRIYHAMVNHLDDTIGNLTDALKDKGMWADTLVVLTSDNGGYVKSDNGGCNTTHTPGGGPGPVDSDIGHGTACFNGEAGANNFPLRGGKYSPWEGGIRVNAFASGGWLPQAVRGTVSSEMIHIADWYGTFSALAGVDPSDAWAAASGLPPVDSLNMVPLLTGVNTTSPRDTILVNKNLIVHKQWKLIRGDTDAIEAGWAGLHYPNGTSISTDTWVGDYDVKCPKAGCLYNVLDDPSEYNECSAAHPDIVKQLSAMMDEESKSIFSVSHKDDPQCKKTAYQKYGGFYGPWLEVA